MLYTFADCALDTDRHRLLCGGEEIHVEPQVFDLLALLVAQAPALVTYDRIIAEVWDGRIVSDATLAARISAARAAVGDDGKRQAIIRTHARRGVQIVSEVDVKGGEPRPTQASELMQDLRMTVSQDGTGIAWSSIGSGAPILRAGHWMTHLNHDLESPIWRPWVARLSRGRRLVRYDPRGTGMSDRDCGPVSLAAWVEDFSAVADAAALDRFDIFCTSQSAAVAVHYATKHPDRVRRLVISGGFAQGTRVRDGARGAALTEGLSAMIEAGWGQPQSGYMHALSAMFIPEADRDDIAHFIDLQIASATPERAVEIREVCSMHDIVGLLPRLEMPVLVAHAMRDSMHPFDQAKLFARGIPDARLLPLDSANHVLLPGEPAFDVLMDAIDDFLAGDRD